MGNIANYLEEALLAHVLKNTALTSPATVYLGIASSSASAAELEAGTLTNEITAYTGNRKPVSFGAISQSGGKATVTNSAAVDFENMPATTVAYAIICNAATAGNILFWAPLTASKTTNSGDTFRIPASGLTVDLD